MERVRPAVRYGDFDEVGRVATMVVEGRRGNGVTGSDWPVVYERIAGENMIDAAGGKIGVLEVTDHVLLWDFDHPEDASLSYLGNPKPLDLEIGGAGGDSGGGRFIEKDSRWFLAGILHGGIPRSGDVDEPKAPYAKTYGQISCHVRFRRPTSGSMMSCDFAN